MFLPFPPESSEQPPWATYGLIAFQVLVAMVVGMSDPAIGALRGGALFESMVLKYREFRPQTWITSTFLHGNEFHLLFNMIFLAAFGPIVEARIGVKRMLLVWCIVGLLTGAMETWTTSGTFMEYVGSSVGASGVIAALMAMVVLWAPGAKVRAIWLLTLGVGARPLGESAHRAGWLVMLYFGIELFRSALGWFGGASAILHLIGAFVGFVIGFVLLKRGDVETNGEDLLGGFQDMRERARRYAEKHEEQSGPCDPESPVDPSLVRSSWDWREYKGPAIAGVTIVVGIMITRRIDLSQGDGLGAMFLGFGLVCAGGLYFAYMRRR